MSKGTGWILVFAIIFLLTQDYLFANWSGRPSLAGLPGWLWWFVAVHLLFILVFALFADKFWKE